MTSGLDSSRVRVLAPSKINLGLEVLGQRADGFHELDTTMVALSLCDELELQRTERSGVQLTVLGPSQSADIPSDERNLAHRAATLVLERSGADGGLDVRLTKRIPSQSGLGGASSDAAAALAGAESALHFSLSVEERADLLGGLGSDCVFFEQAKETGAAHCTGRGELVRPLEAPNPAWIVVLVCPDVHVSTATIFGALHAPQFVPLSGARLNPTVSKGLTALRAAEIQSCLRNQLEDAAIATFPELRAWRKLFDATSGSVSDRLDGGVTARYAMTGSGSTFYALFEGVEEAERSLGDVKRAAADRGLTMRFSGLTETCGFGLHVSSEI